MEKLIVFLILAKFFFLCGSACNTTQLYECQNRFQALTGIDLRLGWQEIKNGVESAYAGNDTGFRGVCRGFHDYGTCMRQNYYECTSLPYLLQNTSYAQYDAYQYIAVFLQAHFACGAGFGVYINNEYCFPSIWQKYRRTFDICMNLWYQRTTENANDPNYPWCALGKGFQDCYTNAFQEGCGNLIDGKWWGCEYARVTVMTHFPFCTTAANRCVYNCTVESACDPNLLYQCQQNFQTLTGIDLRLNWKEVRRQVENSYGGSNDTNYRLVCRGFSEFGDCMKENFYECMNIPYLVQNVSDSLQDAYQYLAIFLQQHFACGAGFGVFLMNQGCLENAWNTRRVELDGCKEDFDFMVGQQLGNRNGPFCYFGNQMQMCYEKVFKSACQGLIDAIWWGCEYGRIDVITQFPFCSTAANRCVQPPGVGGILG